MRDGIRIGQPLHWTEIFYGAYLQTVWEIYPGHTVSVIEGGLKFFGLSIGWRHRESKLGSNRFFVMGVRLTL